MPATPLRIALTLDDAPSVAGRADVAPGDPSRMDRILEVLQRGQVRDCAAFVIGRMAAGEERRLARWLEAGYALGNHTFGHANADRVEPEEFLRDVERCDALLDSIGAFAQGRPRLFRYPYLRRPGHPERRRWLEDRIETLGYRIVPAGLDTFDYQFEVPLGRSVARQDAARIARVEERFLTAATRALVGDARALEAHERRSVRHVAFAHFGIVADRCLDRLVDRLRAAGATFVPLAEALEDPIYLRYRVEEAANGRVAGALVPRSLAGRIRRWAVGQSMRLGLFAQREYGPLRPHLAE